MAQQVKKKFIGNDQVDSTKIKLLKDQAVRGTDSTGSEVELLKLDSEDKLVSRGQEVAFKSQVDSEASARQSADQSLQSSIDVEKGRIDAILLASDADKDSFAEIVQLINSVDTENDSAFASYVLSNDAALAQEVSDRQNGDITLGQDIMTVAGDLETEAMTRFDQDALIQSELDATQVGAGLESDGSYVAPETSNFLSSSTSLKYAIQILDQVIQNSMDDAAMDKQALQDAINAVEVGAGLATDGSYVAPAGSEYLTEATSLKDATERLDSALFDVSASLNIEASRASAEEVRIEAKLDQEILDRAADVNAEESRAMGEEQRIEGKVDQEVLDRIADVNAEETRAIAEEARIEGKVDQEVLDRIAGDSDLQDSIDAEEARALAAEGVLQSNIDVEKGRIDAILLASEADKDSFAEIVQLINSVDTENDSAFASYVLSNNAALAQEVSDRQSNDLALAQELDGISESLQSEIQSRQYFDTALQNEIDAEETRAMGEEARIENKINLEIADRTSEDALIYNEITVVSSGLQTELDATQLGAGLETDGSYVPYSVENDGVTIPLSGATSLRHADLMLDMAIQDTNMTLQATQDALNFKVSKFGDTVSGSLSFSDGTYPNPVTTVDNTGIEIFDAFSQYESINHLSLKQGGFSASYQVSEAGDVQNVMFDQQSGIGFVWRKYDVSVSGFVPMLPTQPEEVAVKAYVDQEISALSSGGSSALAQEIADRQAADSALDARIDVLESVVNFKEKFVLSSTDISNGFITLSHSPESNSMVAAVDRLAIHEGSSEDYTISGSTMTFLNDLVGSGPQALVAGDSIYVKYQYKA